MPDPWCVCVQWSSMSTIIVPQLDPIPIMFASIPSHSKVAVIKDYKEGKWIIFLRDKDNIFCRWNLTEFLTGDPQ